MQYVVTPTMPSIIDVKKTPAWGESRFPARLLERERWYAFLLLAQGSTSSATAQALERDPHTIGQWASAFGEGGLAALIFEQTGGPAFGETQQVVLRAAVQELPAAVGIGLANWNWKVVRQFASERFGISLCRR